MWKRASNSKATSIRGARERVKDYVEKVSRNKNRREIISEWHTYH